MKQIPYIFTVTRQARWHDGLDVVEVTQGGIDWSGPDMLVERYPQLGEGQEFKGMRPAIEAAIKIALQWSRDCRQDTIYIAVGNTGGMGLALEEQRLTHTVFRALRKEAAEFDANLERCAHCGEILGQEKFGFHGEYDCCSQHCAEQHYFSQEEDEDAVAGV